MEKQTIHLGLYGSTATKIMRGMFDDFLFGYVINTMTKRAVSSAKLREAEDGELCLECRPNGLLAASTGKRFAKALREYMKTTGRIGENESGRRADGTAAAEYECVADFLNGSPVKKLVRKYGQEFVDRVVGQPMDPFRVACREQLEKDIEDLRGVAELTRRRAAEYKAAAGYGKARRLSVLADGMDAMIGMLKAESLELKDAV